MWLCFFYAFLIWTNPNNWGLRHRLSLTTNFVSQYWAQLGRGNPHLHSSLKKLMNNAGYHIFYVESNLSSNKIGNGSLVV